MTRNIQNGAAALRNSTQDTGCPAIRHTYIQCP